MKRYVQNREAVEKRLCVNCTSVCVIDACPINRRKYYVYGDARMWLNTVSLYDNMVKVTVEKYT